MTTATRKEPQMNTTASRTRKAIKAAARVISLARCQCVVAHSSPCMGCENLAEAALTAADNTKPTVTVETQIREAYAGLVGSAGWVPLRDLRAALPDLARDVVDQTMTDMQARQAALLVPEENQKTLTHADRAASIHFGGQPRHLITIEQP